MKALVFDAGPIISLTMNNLLWIIKPLKKSFNGDFFITDAIKEELVDKPLATKRFEFEALQVQHRISHGELKVVYMDGELEQKATELLNLANSCYRAKGEWIKIAHYGEMSAIALAIALNAEAAVIDERTVRQLIENPEELRKTMEKHLNNKVETNKNNLKELQSRTRNTKIIRSAELAAIAFEKGLLNKYISDGIKKRTLLDAILWGIKLNGCAITRREIEELIKLEKA